MENNYNIRSVALSKYEAPVVQETTREDWVSYGTNNDYYQYLIDRYTYSPSNNAIIYLNGTAVLTTTIKILNNLIEVQLASGGTSDATPSGTRGIQQLNGSIAQSLIYNRALSATEIKQNYNATKGRYGL
jgi:hypothetical protein